MFFYKNGKVAKVSVSSYKTNRKKLSNAYSKDSEIVAIFYEEENLEYILKSNNEKAIVLSSSLFEEKSKKDSKGAVALKLNKNCILKEALAVEKNELKNLATKFI